MNKKEYAKYERYVDLFFKQEKLENLSGGRITCSECEAPLHLDGICESECPKCGADVEAMNEPSFSWSACECCGSSLGGDRYPASGYSRELNACYEYEICADCLYYTAYGELDGQTMMDIEEEEEEEEEDAWARSTWAREPP